MSHENKNTDTILYLDMDGVLVDFDGGFSKIAQGLAIKEYSKAFGEAKARNTFLDAGIHFWENLEWIHGGKELWNTASRLFHRVYILSSAGTTHPQKAEMVEAGKREWLKKHIPSIPHDHIFVVRGRHLKQQFSTPNSILVDDMNDTIQSWNLKGGFGILHNSNNYKKTINELHDISAPIKLQEIVKRIGL